MKLLIAIPALNEEHSRQQSGNLFRGILQIIVHRHNDSVPGLSDTAQQRIVLPIIP